MSAEKRKHLVNLCFQRRYSQTVSIQLLDGRDGVNSDEKIVALLETDALLD